ncbi:hypothetical protein B0T16DRAFT_436825 [Cercophora newfieldiana]|uniref:N-acetyltransferase domain-containing protein n=1 Tax=Cercophora newfieldiana TaxID=92897 RepID=A0AA39Y464_9PEZI|nr:hypothetical protein B0T16DRAFT_436825 [Cercophora newfieldiana]
MSRLLQKRHCGMDLPGSPGCRKKPAMKPRLGLPTDVDPITHVILSAMPQDPAWVYRFPYRREYPQDHYKYTRMLFEYFLDPAYDDWVVMVIEDALESGRATEIVAFGVFNVSFRNKRAHGPGYQAQDRKSHFLCRNWADASRRRLDAFTHEQVEAYKRFFEPIGPEQIHLQILATLPAFQRRGHGSSICKWAMSLARDENLKDISVMASPMGHELYNWLGFQRVGEFPIRVPDEEVELTLVAMMYDPGA